MKLGPDDVRVLARAVRLDIPEPDLKGVALRLEGLLSAMEEIERELGSVMDAIEPLPPVYPGDEPQETR